MTRKLHSSSRAAYRDFVCLYVRGVRRVGLADPKSMTGSNGSDATGEVMKVGSDVGNQHSQ